MIKSSVFTALSAFLIGIFAGDYLDIHWVLIFTIWATFLLILIVLLKFGKQVFFFKKWIIWCVVMVLFFSGMLGYQLKMPISFEQNYNRLYLENDRLIGQIIDYQKGKGDYDKAIISVKQIVKPHTNVYAQGQILCYIKVSSKVFSEGSVVLLEPELRPIKNKNNPAEFDAEKYWKVKGINKISFLSDENVSELGFIESFSGFWTKSREYLINILKEKISEENQGLVVALTLGDKSKLSIEKMNEATNYLLGRQDFTSFSKLHTDVNNNLCDVYSSEWKVVGDQLRFEISANRFLRNMVRAIVGTMLEVGKGNIPPETVKQIIAAEDRGKAGCSVPAKGLFLQSIEYPYI